MYSLFWFHFMTVLYFTHSTVMDVWFLLFCFISSSAMCTRMYVSWFAHARFSRFCTHLGVELLASRIHRPFYKVISKCLCRALFQFILHQVFRLFHILANIWYSQTLKILPVWYVWSCILIVFKYNRFNFAFPSSF